MPNLSSIARPYALAVFELARENKTISEWNAFLSSAAALTIDPTMQALLSRPQSSDQDKIKSLFEDVLADFLDDEKRNFLSLLALNHRFMILPEIFHAFEEHAAAFEKTCSVQLITAVKVSKDYIKKLSAVLTKRFQRDVSLDCKIDPSIIAGAVLHIDDKVIDASVRGKLTRLLEFSLR